MAGNDVATTVESRFSMNSAQATISGKRIGGRSARGGSVAVGEDIGRIEE
jgi:hypothetical protein